MIDLTEEKIVTTFIKPSLTHEEMVAAYNSKEEIVGFIGGIETDSSILSEEVPSNFVKSTILDEEENETPRTWEDYCNYKISLDETKVFLFMGETDSRGNRQFPVTSEEFYDWADHFGVDNLTTKSEMHALIESPEYTNNEM